MSGRKIMCVFVFFLVLFGARVSMATQSVGEVIFEEGAFSLVSPDKNFEMKIGGRFQLRYWYAYPDKEYPFIIDQPTSTFEVYQARLVVWGRSFGPRWRYFLQLDFVSDPIMKDGYVEYVPSDLFGLRMGYYRVPYTREKITSGAALLFTKRAMSIDALCLQRDIGVMAMGSVINKRLQYQVGVFNGDGEKAKRNTGDSHLYGARIVYEPFGSVGMFEARDKASDGFRLAIGGSFNYNDLPIADLDGDGKMDEALDVRWGEETAMLWGRLFFSSEVNGRIYKPLVTGYEEVVESLGWYAQTGWLLIPDKLQLAARYSWLDPNLDNDPDGTDADEQQEFSLGANYFFHSYRLLLQGSYSLFTKEFPDYEDPKNTSGPYDKELGIEHRFMIQLQLII